VKKKPIKILKKLTGSVRFQFYKPITKKTEPNRTKPKSEKNRAKLEKNRANRAKPKKLSQTGKTEPNWKKLSQN